MTRRPVSRPVRSDVRMAVTPTKGLQSRARVSLAVKLCASGGIVLALVLGGQAAWRHHFRSAPTPTALAEAVERLGKRDCPSSVGVHRLQNIGGPGLPDGMVRAYEVICEHPFPRHDPRLVITYLFKSPSAARAWLRSQGYWLGDTNTYSWWLRQRTLSGRVRLSQRSWRRVMMTLE